jgi:hypothetical protein
MNRLNRFRSHDDDEDDEDNDVIVLQEIPVNMKRERKCCNIKWWKLKSLLIIYYLVHFKAVVLNIW